MPGRLATYLVEPGNMNLWINFPLSLLALPIIKIVFVVIATLQTAEGKRYRYPYIYRVIE